MNLDDEHACNVLGNYRCSTLCPMSRHIYGTQYIIVMQCLSTKFCKFSIPPLFDWVTLHCNRFEALFSHWSDLSLCFNYLFTQFTHSLLHFCKSTHLLLKLPPCYHISSTKAVNSPLNVYLSSIKTPCVKQKIGKSKFRLITCHHQFLNS